MAQWLSWYLKSVSHKKSMAYSDSQILICIRVKWGEKEVFKMLIPGHISQIHYGPAICIFYSYSLSDDPDEDGS